MLIHNFPILFDITRSKKCVSPINSTTGTTCISKSLSFLSFIFFTTVAPFSTITLMMCHCIANNVLKYAGPKPRI